MADQEYLIHEFVDLYYQAVDSLNNNKRDDAQQAYLELYSQYQRILQSSLADMHKKIAHDRLDLLYNQMQKPSVNRFHTHLLSTKHVAVLTVFLLLIGGVIFLRPSIVGLTVFDAAPVWAGEVSVFDVPVQTTLTLDGYELFRGDGLTFLATESSGVRVELSNNLIAVTPLTLGVHSLTLVASDGESTVRKDISIVTE